MPERGRMLDECVASVKAQTFTGWEHLILVDEARVGCARTVNTLAAHAEGEWLFLLADDDLLLPACLAGHLAASTDADIVYSPPIVEGEPDSGFHGQPPDIPSTALIRTELWRRLNGYRRQDQREDHAFWVDAQVVAARFVRVDEQLWRYRFHGENKSRGHVYGVRQ